MKQILATLLICTSLPAAAPKKHKPKPAAPPARTALATRIATILDQPGAREAAWGIEVRDLKTGQVIYSLNPGHFFVPASNTKLFTTALALTRLGPDYQFRTRVIQSGRDLVLIGAGDPNLSGRPIPYAYVPNAPDPPPLAAIEALADQIVARGVRNIPGDIIGDDTAFVYEPYPPGWGLTDTYDDDGPPVSAICVDDNVAKLDVLPTLGDGGVPGTEWHLPFDLFPIDNGVITDNSAAPEFHYQRLPGAHEVRVWGTLPTQAKQSFLLAVDDPAQFAARALKSALERRGVAVGGNAIARHQLPGSPVAEPLVGPAMAERVSPTLLEAARVVDKVSQNLHAEILLRDVALSTTGKGTRPAALDELAKFLLEAGVTPDSYHFSDGSGLSRYNIVTPHAVAGLLQYMGNGPIHEQWISLLPVGGVDGSLRTRFSTTRLNGEIHAKTGSLTHVSALSGYGVHRDGSTLVFSILTNNYGEKTAVIRGVIDQLCAALLD